MKNYIKLMRVHHYIKNLLVFAVLACSGQIFNYSKFIAALLGFIAFSMVSSVVYIINDIRDREKDRLHPTKSKRPIASGAVTVNNAYILAAILIIITIICSYFIHNYFAAAMLLIYVIINLMYSFGLKNIPIIDVTILVLGFLIRILYGGMITEISISNWLYLTVIALSFYFALGKRRNEIKQIGNGETRKVLKSYPINFLDKNMYMCLALANVFYALWSMDEKTMQLYHSKYLIFTVPLVLIITMKYSLDIEGVSDGDPVEVLIHDKMLLVLCLIYAVLMFTILYI